jgi:hypothetical protein
VEGFHESTTDEVAGTAEIHVGEEGGVVFFTTEIGGDGVERKETFPAASYAATVYEYTAPGITASV